MELTAVRASCTFRIMGLTGCFPRSVTGVAKVRSCIAQTSTHQVGIDLVEVFDLRNLAVRPSTTHVMADALDPAGNNLDMLSFTPEHASEVKTSTADHCRTG